jgi:2-(1,2-epoxy-1,2-dihydrophenyl)acetyl-CoA isomerase
MANARVRFSIANGIARVVFCDAERHHAVDELFTQELADAARQCEAAPDLKAVLMTAEGKDFCVGGDLREFIAERPRIHTHVRQMTVHFHAAILGFNRLPVPVIAGVNGVAAGGGFSLVCMADLAIAARSAKFNFAYTKSGLTPDGGATFFLPRLVGAQRAFDLMATNPTLTAEQALGLGLVARVVDDEALAQTLEETVTKIASAPANANGRLKMLLRASLNNSLEEQFELEARSIAMGSTHPETQAAIDGFFQRSQR